MASIAQSSKRSRRVSQIRKGLKLLLGGRCAYCGDTCLGRLEVDHRDGCTWVQKKYNTETRWYRYLREYREGVRLRLLCRSCNARENQWTHGTRKERGTKVLSFAPGLGPYSNTLMWDARKKTG